MRQRGVDCREVTLHVGAGTFKPVKSELIADHEMHEEYIEVSRELVGRMIDADASVIAVGTTSVRTIESLYYIGAAIAADGSIEPDSFSVNQWTPYEKEYTLPAVDALRALYDYMQVRSLEKIHAHTRIMIAPGYKYRIVKAIVTNFHQPKSTLLLLVSAFVSGDWKKIYDYALANDFRFLSYGDSSLLIP
jgi:S-adenosylmethionine:tRNA ribosyltransferase-isomerase